MNNQGELILYRDPSGDMKIDVRLEDETVWLSQKQMAELFHKSKKTISEHITRIFEEGELKRSSTVWEYPGGMEAGEEVPIPLENQGSESIDNEGGRTVRKFRTVAQSADSQQGGLSGKSSAELLSAENDQSADNEMDRTVRKFRTVAQNADSQGLTGASPLAENQVAVTTEPSAIPESIEAIQPQLTRPPTIKTFVLPQQEGNRTIGRPVEHYSLDVIISVGYRVKSLQGTQFRIWATQRLREYITKGFVINDEQLQGGRTTRNYFDELLERVRNIRTSERNFYCKVLDIFATSADYDPRTNYARKFFAVVQNKFHFAITGMTATEIIAKRCSSKKENMGLTNWKGPLVTRQQAQVAKNYLRELELHRMNLLVEQFLAYAELQILEKKVIYMIDWIHKLDQFLQFNEKEVLQDAGKVSRKEMETKVRLQLRKFNESQKLP